MLTYRYNKDELKNIPFKNSNKIKNYKIFLKILNLFFFNKSVSD